MALSISTYVLGPIENNTYLIVDSASNRAAVIDPSSASEKILIYIQENKLSLEFLLITHAHFDHIGGVKWFNSQFNKKLTVALHSFDLSLWNDGGGSKDFGFDLNIGSAPNQLLSNGQILSLGETPIEVIHTPGHTPGHVTFLAHKDMAAFCGDLIFCHGIGRTDLATGNTNDLLASIREKIFSLDPNTILYPGHGPKTTVLEEKENNPFM